MSDPVKFDTRIIRHQIRRRVTTAAEFQSHLDSLEDCAEMAEETETRFDNPYEQRHDSDEAAGAAEVSLED
jgi:hypothetical protein